MSPELDRPLWAWATITHEGEPSLVGLFDTNLHVHHPMISFSEAIIKGERARAAALHHQRTTGQRVYLLRFDRVQRIMEIGSPESE